MLKSMVALAAVATLGACATTAPVIDAPAVHGETPGFVCSEAGLDSFVGQPATAELGVNVVARSGARTLRWIPQGSAVTMDFRQDRVNVDLDRQNRVTKVSCG